jgi:hypothetical protein
MCSSRLKGEDGFFIPGGARYVSIVVPTCFVENYKRNALSSTQVLRDYEIPLPVNFSVMRLDKT